MKSLKKSLFVFALLLSLVLPSVSSAEVGDYTDTTFNTYIPGVSGLALFFDGTFFWVYDALDTDIHKFNSDMEYLETSFDTAASGADSIFGLTMYDTFFWAVDLADDEVYKYNADGTYTGFSFDVAADGIAFPRGIAGHDDFLWIVDSQDAEVYKYNTDGTYTGVSFDTAASGAANPQGIVFQNDFFWIIDQTDDEVYKYNPDGTYTGVSFDTAASGNTEPTEIASYTDGFYILDTHFLDRKIYHYDVDFNLIEKFSADYSATPQAIVFYDDAFWIIDENDDDIHKYDSNGTPLYETFDLTADGIDWVYTMAEHDGFFWLPSLITDLVYKINPDGTTTGVTFNPETEIGLDVNLRGIAFYDGFFWITNGFDNKVYKFNPDGTYANMSFDVTGSGAGDIYGIVGFEDALWIVDQTDAEVYKYNLDGSYANFSFDLAASGNGNPFDITVHNDFFWITDKADRKVYKYVALEDTTPPTLTQTTPIGTTTDTTPDYTFTTDEAGDITYGGSCASVTTEAIVGANTITMNILAPGTYADCTITVTDAADNESDELAISSFTIEEESRGSSSGSRRSTTKVTTPSLIEPLSPQVPSDCLPTYSYSPSTGAKCPTSTTTPPTDPSTPPTPPLCTLTLTLKQGSTGNEVKCLQTKLNITSDGIFGPLTKAAVVAFQTSKNLVPDGIVGPVTRGEMNQSGI